MKAKIQTMKKLFSYLFVLFLGAFGYSIHKDAIREAEQRGYNASTEMARAECDERIEQLKKELTTAQDSLEKVMKINHDLEIEIETLIRFYEGEIAKMRQQYKLEKSTMVKNFTDSLSIRDSLIDSLQRQKEVLLDIQQKIIHAHAHAHANGPQAPVQPTDASGYSEGLTIALGVGSFILYLFFSLFLIAALQRFVRWLMGKRR